MIVICPEYHFLFFKQRYAVTHYPHLESALWHALRYQARISGDSRAWFNIDYRLANDFPR
ncbi:TPA: tryptophanase leader peptide [Yersinia enterocolitica]